MDSSLNNPDTLSPQPICFYHQLSPAQSIKISHSHSISNDLSSEIRHFSPVKSPIPCRICLQTTSEDLISPCNCKGTHSYVHPSCLKNWILAQSNQLSKKSCELCLKPYNISYTYNLKCRFSATHWIPLLFLFLFILSILSTTLFYLVKYEPKDPMVFTFLIVFSSISILLTLISIYLIIQECVYKEINTLVQTSENTLDQTSN